MRKVIGIGETVLDIIFKGGKPIEAVPGGSSFNALVSLGRSGVNASFISEAGNDRIGEYVIQFLRDNGVDADNVSIFSDSKSPLSLAFLDDNNNADYIFYKDHPHDQLEFATPDIQPNDIVLFGSFFALNPVVRPQVAGFLEYAKEHGAILYYDVNFRASHQNDIMKITPNLIENLAAMRTSASSTRSLRLTRCIMPRSASTARSLSAPRAQSQWRFVPRMDLPRAILRRRPGR